jgi:hypothetical protein
MPDNYDTLQQLKMTLARWKAPSSWDVILQDEPLDKPKGEWVPNGACNLTTNGQTVTIPLGITLTNTSSTERYIMLQYNYNSEEIAIARQLAEEKVAQVLAIVRRGTDGTGTGQGNLWSDTAYGQGNYLPSGGIQPERLPYPRNRKEMRTYKTISHRLPELIRQAEKVLGPRRDARLTSEWNAEFWEMVTRTAPRVETGTRQPPLRRG